MKKINWVLLGDIIVVGLFMVFIYLWISSVINENTFVIDSCKKSVVGKGGCDAVISGFEYHQKSNSCVRDFTSGCSGEAPFSTIEECEETCVEKEWW